MKYILKIFALILVTFFALGLLVSISNDLLLRGIAGIEWYWQGAVTVLVFFVAFITSQLFDLAILKLFPQKYPISSSHISKHIEQPIDNFLKRDKQISSLAYRFTLTCSFGFAAISIIGIWLNCFWGDKYYSSIIFNLVYTWTIFKLAQSLIKLPKSTYYDLYK